jgi:hypothetical protein
VTYITDKEGCPLSYQRESTSRSYDAAIKAFEDAINEGQAAYIIGTDICYKYLSSSHQGAKKED